MDPTAAVINNAIFDAVGVRMKTLPITPEKILRALKEKARRIIEAYATTSRVFTAKVPSAAEPQSKSIPIFHHEGREEHEAKKLFCLNLLRVLRGGRIFFCAAH